ncbi:hypothetical protein ATN83_4511 [Raoultella ornithinolytica]|nr:hypothetical protein ATN83_4511 [Raoultella ornithinolytica]KDV96507.1 hypothetical protein AB00_0113 [Raoultella ornithinolytica 2-156-04_S1_C1]KDX16574.1 hypothetical protein AB28_0114 [Raoultella ornithinolytica 2-156-04_S1_C2]
MSHPAFLLCFIVPAQNHSVGSPPGAPGPSGGIHRPQGI